MYDPKSEAREFLGDDAADATAKACSYFGREASELVVREVAGVKLPRAGKAARFQQNIGHGRRPAILEGDLNFMASAAAGHETLAGDGDIGDARNRAAHDAAQVEDARAIFGVGSRCPCLVGAVHDNFRGFHRRHGDTTPI